MRAVATLGLWAWAWACTAPAEEVAVEGPCRSVRLADQGQVTVAFASGEVTGVLAGVRIDAGRRADLEALLSRLPTAEGRLSCTVDPSASPARVRVTYVAWQDKSGDVHEDLADTLVAQGLAVRE